MTDELDNLRPEVRGALDVVANDARCVCSEAYTSRNMKDPACNHDTLPYIETLRAELVRLADENRELRQGREQARNDRVDEIRKRVDAEAELAAKDAATCEWHHDLDEDTWDSACGERWTFIEGGPAENDVQFCHGCGKRVRLLVVTATEAGSTGSQPASRTPDPTPLG